MEGTYNYQNLVYYIFDLTCTHYNKAKRKSTVYAHCLFVCLLICDSLIGAIIIVFGLYSLVWGKSKDPRGLSEEAVDPLDEKSSTSVVALELPITNTNNKSTNISN